MKKHLILSSLIFIPFLASCNTSRVNTPNSPFKDDKYVRIGMKTDGHHKIDVNMSNEEYNELKSYIDTAQIDENVTKYHRQQEDRDLKYAYFGKESSAISQCTLTSISEDLNRFSNRVRTDTSFTNKEIQTANGGIQKTKTNATEYVFDSNYHKKDEYGKYEIRRATEVVGEDQVVEQVQDPTVYEDTSETLYQNFGLKPFTSRIRSHFSSDLGFKLLGDNNHAVYGKAGEDIYIIREGHSKFIENYSTTMGRTYKAVDNYFYEGSLQRYKVPTPGNEDEYKYRFLDFRFYHELLILSKAFSSEESIPVLYLEKPALIEFSETTYSDITYLDADEDYPEYTDLIPEKTPQ